MEGHPTKKFAPKSPNEVQQTCCQASLIRSFWPTLDPPPVDIPFWPLLYFWCLTFCISRIFFIISSVLIVCTVYRFKCGLSTLGVLRSIEESPYVMSQAFLHVEQNLDATMMESIFMQINWSTPGSNRHTQERTTITHWRDVLQDLEGSVNLYILNLKHTSFNS